MQKKILSLVLTFCMLLSMFPFVMGASADENVIEVSNAGELLAVMREIDSGGKINAAEAVSGWGASDTIRLTADIDMRSTLASDHRYVIGSDDQKFAGIFDGNGHTITIDTSVRGLFGNVDGGTVKDLTVAGAATGANSVGGIVGTLTSGTVENCINLRTVNATGTSCGGVVGNMIAGTVTGCINRGAMTFGGTWCGGVVGLAKSTGAGNLITDCINEGDAESKADMVGGIVGYLISAPGTAKISGCINRGAISSTVTGTYNTSNKKYTGKGNVGGIAGRIEVRSGGTSITLETSANYGKIYGDEYVGGIVGYALGIAGEPAIVDQCVNNCEISAEKLSSRTESAVISGTDCGGIVGLTNTATVTNCQNHGTVTSKSNLKNFGGIVGRSAAKTDSITLCCNDGAVTSTSNQKGGVIGGLTSADATASDNYWLSTTAAKAYGTNNGDSDVSFTAAQAAERGTFSALLLASDKWLFSTKLELASFHTHTFNVAVSEGDAGHRLDCACGEHGQVVAHDFDDENTCTVCGYVKVECDHATTHDVITLAPTCATTGLKDVVCDVCGNTIASGVEVAVDPDNHIGNLVLGFNKNEAEEIDYYCDACDTVIAEDYNYATDIYVSATGVEIAMGTVTEDNLPGAEDNPFADFADAMTYAAYAAEQNKDAVTVHILDSAVAPANYASPASNYLITITGGELNFNTAPRRFFANGDITFEDITFKTNATDGVFMFGQNHNFTFGEGIVMGNATTTAVSGFASINTVKAYVFGGFEGTATPAAMDTHLTVRSGNYWFIGGWNRLGLTTTGTGHVTVGKTNANDELVTKYLVPFSTGDQLISADSESTVVVDGDIDVQFLYIGTQNGGTADKCYTTNFVLQGNISPNYPAYNGGLGFDITGTPANKTGVTNVYVDERVDTAIVDSYAFFGDGASVNPDTAIATLKYPTTYYTYIQYCANVLGGHTIVDDVCTRCGFSASCAHEHTHEEITLAATCTTVGSKNIVCEDCYTILETIEIPVDPNNHVAVHGAVWSVDEDNGGYKLICPACENAIVSGAEEPVVYLDNNTARSASVGDDNLDGLTEGTAVKTFDEAFARLAVTGGRIVLADRYEITGTTTLPAHDKMVTISAVLNENGGAQTGFLNKGHGLIFNMNGPITFEKIVFNSELTTTATTSGTYYKILTLAANWNDFTIGEGVTGFGGYYIVVGNSQATKNSGDETKTVNIVLNRVLAGNTRLPDATSDTGYKTGATAFYERIYLMDRYNGTDLVTKNKTVNATFNNTTAGTVYYATTSSTSQNAQMENCALNLTIGKKNDSDKGTGVLITELIASGNMSGATGTAYLDNFTLNINDDVSKIATLGLYNLKNATINLSKASDGRSVEFASGITVSQSDAYKAGAGADVEETVTANYGSHSFVKGKTIQVNEAYTLTRNVTDECTWNEGEITTPAAAGVPGVMTYTCTVCGRTKTEEIPFDCTTHTPIAKADGTYYCAVCGEVIDELRTADVVASVAPTEAVVGETFTMDVSLEATTPFWGAQFTVDAPEGFTLTDADFKIADAGEELTGNLAVLGGSEVALPYNVALIHMGTEEDTLAKTVVVTLTFAVAETVEAGDYVITLTPVEAIRADEVTTLDMMTVSAEVSVTAEVAHVHELTLIPAVAADCTTAGNNAYYYCAGCGLYFADAEGTVETTVEAQTISALGHNMTAAPAKDATCTEAGNNAYWTCDRCNKVFADANGETETTVEAQTISALGHNMTETPAVPATCTEAGNNAYWTCDRCNKVFADANGETETTVEAQTISALGHNMTETPAVPATCTEAGHNAYWTCDRCNKVFADANGETETTVEAQTIPATGEHSYGAGVLTPATRETEAYYTYTCANCGESYVEYLEPTAMNVSFVHALVVSSEYSLNFRIQNTVVAGASDYWMEFETFAPASETGTITIAEAEAQGTKQQKFASPGISAKNLNDKIVAKLYMIKDGIKYVSQADEYNVVNYYLQASAAYASAAEGTKNYYLIKALEAILNYGSFTQTYFGYNTEAKAGDDHSGLVNLHMPEDVRKTSIADYADVVAEQQRIEYDDCASPLFNFSSTAVIMQQKITNNLKYTFVDKTYDYTTLTFRGTYTTINNEVKEIEIPGTAMTATGTKTRTLNVYIDTVAAKDLRQMVTGALYDADGNQVSISVASSVESYAVRIPDAAQYESVKAAILGVLDYSDYVALYLAK